MSPIEVLSVCCPINANHAQTARFNTYILLLLSNGTMSLEILVPADRLLGTGLRDTVRQVTRGVSIVLLLHPTAHTCCPCASLVEAPLGESTVLSATAEACAHEDRWSSCAGGPEGWGKQNRRRALGVSVLDLCTIRSTCMLVSAVMTPRARVSPPSTQKGASIQTKPWSRPDCMLMLH